MASLEHHSPPRLQHQPPRPVLPVLPDLLLLQHPERLAGEVSGLDAGGVASGFPAKLGKKLGIPSFSEFSYHSLSKGR